MTGIIHQQGVANSGVNLGGIGTGGVEIWPDGRLHHWNMVNSRPWAAYQKGRHAIDPIEPGVMDADFFIRIEESGKRPIYRWLFAGHGLIAGTASHFFRHHKYFFIRSMPSIRYRAEYPFVTLEYVDDEFPVEVTLTAWTSFIPRDVKNSSLPGAYFDFKVKSRSKKPLKVSIVWQQQNLAGYAAGTVVQKHSKARSAGASIVRMEGSSADPDHVSSGCMSMWATPRNGQTVTSVAGNPYMQNLIWSVHQTGGLAGPLFPDRIKREEINPTPPADVPNKGWLCVQDTIKPGASVELHMGLAWYFPNHCSIRGTRVGHAYENWFDNSVEVASYLVRNRERFLAASRLMPKTLMESTLPESLKLSLLDQLNTLTKSTHFIKDGRFGLQEGHGCCAFNTMDVDHYSSYALSLVMPQLRQTVLEMHTAMAHPKNGKMYHGFEGTVENYPSGGEHGYNRWDCCCQYVLQVYRDTKWSGNSKLLKACWPAAVRTMDLIASMDFYDVGLPYIEGGITYDHWRMKGIVTYMAGIYLAALLAMEDMAGVLGHRDAAGVYRALFDRGLASFEKILWNGRQYLLYYGRRPKSEQTEYAHEGHEGHLDPQAPCECCQRPDDCVELKDTGVMTDLLNGHATAAMMGLRPFLEPARVRRQLKLILERNMQDENLCVVNGSYPDGHFLDGWPFMQWQTPWTGSEYFLAAQLYEAGMTREGDRVVDMVYQRHVREGMRFDHAECNNHYARPLCLWGALTMRLGFDYDGFRKVLRLAPRQKRYSGLLPSSLCTGKVVVEPGLLRANVLDGRLPVSSVVIPACRGKSPRATVKLNGKPLGSSAAADGDKLVRVQLDRPIVLAAGDELQIRV